METNASFIFIIILLVMVLNSCNIAMTTRSMSMSAARIVELSEAMRADCQR
jgi:hypothetical protein